MFVFLLVCLFWTGAFAASSSDVGIGIAMALAMLLGLIGSTIGNGVPTDHFLIILACLFGISALATAVSGLVRAIHRRPGMWTSFSCSISLAAFPLVGWNAFETLVQASR